MVYCHVRLWMTKALNEPLMIITIADITLTLNDTKYLSFIDVFVFPLKDLSLWVRI